jgi:methionyl aminopeptidase
VAGFCPWLRLAYAVVTPDRLIILVCNEADRVDARGARPDAEVRCVSSSEYAGELVRLIAELGAERGRVGVAGIEGPFPAADYAAVCSQFSNAEMINMLPELRQATAVKTARELSALRESAAIVEAGLRAVRAAIRPGVTCQQLAAKAEAALRNRGGKESLVMVGADHTFSRRPTSRTISETDLVTAYVEAAGPTDYWVEAAAMFSVGTVSEATLRLAATCSHALLLAESLLQPGQTGEDVSNSVIQEVRGNGFSLNSQMGHGIGLDDQDLPIIGPGGEALSEGMTVAVHPQIWHASSMLAASSGNTYFIGRTGAQALVRFPTGMLQAAK